jgi:clan AA aspartic protease
VIVGSVSSKLEALVRLSIHGPRSEVETKAVLDTGFNGALALPPDLIGELGLRLKTRGSAVLADGTEISLDVHEALISWDGRLLRVLVGAANSDPLLGMALLHGHELAVRVVEGGEVLIKRLYSDPGDTSAGIA